MIEPLPRNTSSERTNSYSAYRTLQKHRSQYAFLLRSVVVLAVIIVYYVKGLTSHADGDSHDVNNYLSAAHHGRQLLSSAQLNTSKLAKDLNVSFVENHSVASIRNDVAANCTPAAILQFPSDGLTRAQRQHGWIVLHTLVAIYCFWMLAVICDDYFVPAIEQICLTVCRRMQKDVVGATLMAAATSSSEMFMNCVGTFVTMGDIGASTIVGSAVFNVLAIPACCGLFVGHCVQLDWWPVTRDCLMYCMAVLVLIATLYDGHIMWYEALTMTLLYFVYLAVMYYNDDVACSARKLLLKYQRSWRRDRAYCKVDELTPILAAFKITTTTPRSCDVDIESNEGTADRYTAANLANSPWERSGRATCEWALRWPITLLLWLTIPDSRKHPTWKHWTFLISVVWIGAISYLVAFVITIVGDTLEVPDSVMGLTILAAGMSVPEAVSSIIVSRQGQGAMGISNSLGSNTFDILLCLGLPWFVKAYFLPANHGENWVTLGSSGLIYSVVFLLTTLLGLYVAFLANSFMLNWRIGVACAVMYVAFLIVASMIELNVIFLVNLPMCRH